MIQVLKAAIIVVALSTASSCMKKPDMTIDDGPEADAAAIQSALMDAWGGDELTAIRPGEFVLMEKTVALADLPPSPVLQIGETMTSVIDEGIQWRFSKKEQWKEFLNDGQERLSTYDRQFVVGQDGSIGLNSNSLRDLAQELRTATSSDTERILASLPWSYRLMILLVNSCVKSPTWKVSCHNLTATREVLPAPNDIANSPECGGLPNCRWNKVVIAFDLIAEFKDEDTGEQVRSKTRYTAKISTQGPFMSRLTDFCIQGIAKIPANEDSPEQSFPVKICESIRHFRRGI